MMTRFLLLLFAFAALFVPKGVWAAGDDIVYIVKSGDTLIGLGNRYFAHDTDYIGVQKANRISNDRAIPVGTQLRINRKYLKYQASSARLVGVRGNVTLLRAGASSPAANGATLGEGVTVRTAGSSFVTLSLENGSRISLPSNSDVKIVRLRRYVIDSSLDYDFDVGRGGAKSKVTPLTNPNDRYSVKTPKAVSAVRGTEFQSRYDEASGRDFAEVTEGGLAVELLGGKPAPLAAGNGFAVTADGSVISEALLPAVEMRDAGKVQKEKTVRFDLPKSGAVAATKIALSSDAGFVEQLADASSASDSIEFSDIDDGNYFVRFRSVSANGIEGMPATYAFKRRLNSVSASGAASAFGYDFKWLGEGKGTIRYHFQLYRGKAEGVPMVDEAGLNAQQISLSDLPSDDYYWRVASVQYIDGEVSTSWTPFEKLTVSAQ
jgi:hypothetical protein